MLFFLTSRLISSIAAFLYPGYASYKTLSQRPASEADLERWLMYWSVLGCIVGVEYVAEWLVSWIPFYYTMKTLFLLYLALPQTRGSTYLYTNHLQPFFHAHESQIDAALVSLKYRIYTFLQDRIRLLWEHVAATLGQQQQQAATDPATAVNAAASADPMSGPAQLVSSLWRSYGPAIVASGTSLLRQSAASTSANATATLLNYPAASPPIPPAAVRQDTSQSVRERKRQLEAELASLTAAVESMAPAGQEIHGGPAAYVSSRAGSSGDLRERTSGTGKFEEIEMPNDVEGYDGSGMSSTVGARRTSWFGWGAATPGDRVKNE